MKKPALPLVALAWLAVACGGGGGTQAASPTAPTAQTTSPSATPSTSPSPSPTPTCLPDGTTLHLTAKGISFSTDCLAVKAGTAFAIVFSNKDGIGIHHNVDIALEDGTSVFYGNPILGGKVTYHVQALDAGVYPFQCDIHPSAMQGTLVVR
jgi:plastocyanin